jgi:hypothetical protein
MKQKIEIYGKGYDIKEIFGINQSQISENVK